VLLLIATRSPAGHLVAKACANAYRQGAEAFGWTSAIPSRARCAMEATWWAGAWLPAFWEALQMPIAVRIVLSSNGHAEVSCATSDIGTGTYTIMTQVAADMLGVATREHHH